MMKGVIMRNTALIQARIEPELKDEVDSILNNNGLDIPTAIRIFFAKIRQVGGIPFEVRNYNPETISAMNEAIQISRDSDVASYNNFAEIMAEIDSDSE
jgi:DNA-damage-inducible protein J